MNSLETSIQRRILKITLHGHSWTIIAARESTLSCRGGAGQIIRTFPVLRPSRLRSATRNFALPGELSVMDRGEEFDDFTWKWFLLPAGIEENC